MSSGRNGRGDVDDCCCWRGCCGCDSRSGCDPVVWMSISPSSFPAVVVFSRGANKAVGEVGRDGHPHLLKALSSVRICIVSEDVEGWKRWDVAGKLEIGMAGLQIRGKVRRSWDVCRLSDP